jgi:uncharacterized protein involved in outer membrane biogenesis
VKRLIIILLLVAAAVGVSARLWGNQLLGQALDAQLAPLLTRQLGLPVQLAPIDARALTLKAHSAKLTMGDPADPAVAATDVEVRLSWPDLLRGEVRLVFARAGDLAIKPSRWPGSGNPLPTSYRFLDPWLPRRLAFDSGRYISGQGNAYPLQDAAWSRLPGGGMRLSWHEQRKGGLAGLEARLDSLSDLLDLADFRLNLDGAIDGAPDSAFSLTAHIQPGDDKAYKLDATLQAINARLTTQASGSQRWRWPDTSQSHYEQLDLGALGGFLALYGDPAKGEDAGSFLANPLPALNLIPHKGTLTIDQANLDKETVRNVRLNFHADQQGLRIDPLQLEGPGAHLGGSIAIDSAPDGWRFSLDMNLNAKEGGSIGPVFKDTQWRWEEGDAQLDGHGETWGDLLYSLEGHLRARGHHQGRERTPVKVAAALDSREGIFALDTLEVTLGEGRFQGSAALSGSDQRKLTLQLTGDKLDLDFLFEGEEDLNRPGVAIPEYLGVFPSLDLDWRINVTGLRAPGLTLASAGAHLDRTSVWGKLTAEAIGVTGGTLDLTLESSFPDGENADFQVQLDFERLDLPSMFQQPNFLHSRSSGTMHFESQGSDLRDIFVDMRGTTKLAVEVRPDNDWQRPARDVEKLELTGASRFVVDGMDIVGVTLSGLDLDSIDHDLTGTLSMVANRDPWIIADLQSEMLDVDGLLQLLPETTEEADQTNALQTVRDLGPAKLTLKVDALSVGEAPISKLDLEMAADEDLFQISNIAFTARGSRLEGKGEVTWQDTLAKVELATTLTDVDIDQFLIRDPALEHVRVSGTAQLSSEGRTVAELVGNLAGHVDLRSREIDPDSGEPERLLLMKAQRLADGGLADVEKLRLADNHLSGTVRYTRGDIPQLDIELHDGAFSLRPWETRHVETETAAQQAARERGGIGRAASASANAVGRILRAPLRLFEAGDDNSNKDRFFSSEPLPLDGLHKINLTLKGQLDTLESSIATLHRLSFDGQVKDGVLTASASTEELNGGQAKAELTLDASATPPSVALRADFENVRGITVTETYTRSGFASITARGQSPAELAASLDGLLYLELGPGPFTYQSTSLLSASLARQVFTTLIPGAERQTPQLECGVTVAEFNQGKGVTPYGYAIRTNQANLLGHLKVNLAKETMEMNFESRSREGVGLSVGNMLSTTVQVRGSLTNPSIVPRATSLAFRGWAAFMTAGLSVVAESVLKRAMASENPCPPIIRLIQDEMCPKSEIARSSPRMCPQAQTTRSD